jgi:hypothetical protein
MAFAVWSRTATFLCRQLEGAALSDEERQNHRAHAMSLIYD